METVKNRRSIRKYAGKPVDEELLRRLLEVSERTQTMGNMQLYSVVVTRSEEVKKRLAPAHFNQPMVTQAPVILTICADFNRTVKWAEQRKAQPGYDNFLSFLNAATDAVVYADVLQSGRGGRVGDLLFGYDFVYAVPDYRHLAVAPLGDAGGDTHRGMA